MSASAPPTPVSLVPHPMSLPIVIPPQLGPASISKPPTPQSHSMSQPSTPTSIGPMRRRVSDKCNLPISAGKIKSYGCREIIIRVNVRYRETCENQTSFEPAFAFIIDRCSLYTGFKINKAFLHCDFL